LRLFRKSGRGTTSHQKLVNEYKEGRSIDNQLICICGPTASGKTELAIELARRLPSEVISADSMQIYCGMDIGTAKPTLEERQGIPHHLLDVCQPDEPFSVVRYTELADAAAQDILSRGMIPIVAGGTGLYMDALINGHPFPGGENVSPIREKYRRMAEQQGAQAVHDCLARVDPVGAARLHPNNLKRVIRALEVFEQTGTPIDTFNALHQPPAPKYRAIKIGLHTSDRQILYNRINRRVEEMTARGLLEEVKRLRLAETAAQAIGYKELLSYLRGETALSDCVALIQRRSRQYAKRQLTWLRRDASIYWIVYDSREQFPAVLQNVTNYLQKHGVQYYCHF